MTSFYFIFSTKSTPPVGLEPTTARLRAARSTDWARKATNVTYLTYLFFQYYNNPIRLWTLYNIYTYPYTLTHIYLLPYIDRCRLLFYISVSAWSSSCCLLSLSSHVLYHFLFFPLPLLHLLYPSYSYLDFLLLFIFEMRFLFSCRFIIYPPDTFLTCFSPILILLSGILFYCWLVRKLPWLSRQSDRLLTDRS